MLIVIFCHLWQRFDEQSSSFFWEFLQKTHNSLLKHLISCFITRTLTFSANSDKVLLSHKLLNLFIHFSINLEAVYLTIRESEHKSTKIINNPQPKNNTNIFFYVRSYYNTLIWNNKLAIYDNVL